MTTTMAKSQMVLDLDGTTTAGFVLAFSGSFDIDSKDPLIQGMKLGHTVTLTIDDGMGNTVDVDAKVSGRGWTVKEDKEAGDVVTHTIRVKVI